VRVQVLVTGRVQGVGFRYFTAARARQLGLTGIARNLPNGQVHITAEGDRAALDALIDAVRAGPPGAYVRDVRVEWEDAPAREQEFLIR
jgi:acylphosphatase